MKKLILAAAAALTLGMGVASAQNLNGYTTDHQSAPSNVYSTAGG